MRNKTFLILAFSLMFAGVSAYGLDNIPQEWSDPDCMLVAVEEQHRWVVTEWFDLNADPMLQGAREYLPYYVQYQVCDGVERMYIPLHLSAVDYLAP